MYFNLLFETFLQNWQIVLLFFAIAILYSSVGFGGGSSYLAVLALTSMTFPQIRATALLCNIVVVSNASYIFAKKSVYNWKKVLPLVAFSTPLAFVGGYLKITNQFFYMLLGIILLIAAILMWFSKYLNQKNSTKNTHNTLIKDAFFGGFIGFVSGMAGVGGGIFLAPLLHLTNWDTPKKIAATTSLFILVNSIGGLLGQFQNLHFSVDKNFTLMLLLAVFVGGKIGSKINNQKISPFVLKRMTAILIAFVSIKILYKHLF